MFYTVADEMNKSLRIFIMLAVNLLLSGFFGLAFAFLHFLWLEFATVKYAPKVQYTEQYQLQFAVGVTTVFLVLCIVRQVQSQFKENLPTPKAFGTLVTIVMIAMFCLTPVNGGNFPSYIMDYYNLGKSTPEPPNKTATTTKTNPPVKFGSALKRDME